MKLKRLMALALTLVLTLSLTVLPASAATFTDMASHWARTDVERLANDGLIKGYSDGSFKPDAKMTAAEALLFCARATGLDNATKTKIAATRINELRVLLPAEIFPWAANEMALCLETGIITHDELEALCRSGAIARELSRENLSFYLVRAMQLAPLAKSLASYPLTFTDAAAISPGLQPYVYLLSMYGIVKGDENNAFNPRGGVTRAAMATMLRRTLAFMEDQGIAVELAAYTDYAFYGGVITSASTGANGVTLLALKTLGGPRTISLPAGIRIYENNMKAAVSALKPGCYVRVNLNRSEGPESVRLGGVPTAVSGTVATLDVPTGALTVNVNGTSYAYTMDRFTEVKTGKSVGDKSILDANAGYTKVTCQIDALGHLVTADFSGGMHVEEGLIADVSKIGTSVATLEVLGFDGVLRSYKIPVAAAVAVNGTGGALSASYKGKYVALSLTDDDKTVTAVAVDTKTVYLQGAIKGTSYSKSPNKITLKDFASGKTETYEIAPSAVITYNDEPIAFNRISTGWFATLMLSGQQVMTLAAYPGASTTEGLITDITYEENDFTVTVKRADETEVRFTMSLYDPPHLYRNGKEVMFDKIRIGDTAVVTVRYNEVDSLEATAQSANIKGTITRISSTVNGVILDLTLEDGSTVTHQIANNVTVTRGDKFLQVGALQPGYKVSMVTDGKEIISIVVDKSVATNNMLTGSVLYVNTDDWSVMLRSSNATGNDVILKVYVVGANMMDTTGQQITIHSLRAGDALQLYGNYDDQGFRAHIVIRI